MSANGELNLPPYDPDSPSLIHNITIFLYSYDTGRNFTISNGTASANNETLGDIMLSEPGSTVKHVKWTVSISSRPANLQNNKELLRCQ